MIDPGLRIGVVGATGAVGRVTLEYLRERGHTNVRAFASRRSAGSIGRRRRGRGGDGGGARRRRSRRLLLLRRDAAEPRARPARGGRGCALRRQVGGVPAHAGHPARRAGGQRRARARARRDRREPELLRDPAHDGARSAARRGGAAKRAGRDVPVGLRRRRGRDRASFAARRRTTTGCAWTGTSTASSTTRRSSSARRRGRSSSFPTFP